MHDGAITAAHASVARDAAAEEVSAVSEQLAGIQGCGIVEFETVEEAATAVASLDRSTVWSQLSVTPGTSMP